MKIAVIGWIFILTCINGIAQNNKPDKNSVDVLHYNFEIELQDQSDNIKGVATLEFLAKQNINTIELDLAAIDAKGKGMQVLNIESGEKKLTYNHASNKLNIKLPELLQEGEKGWIKIHYSGVPKDGLIISKNKYNKQTFFADNWPDRAHNWLPCIDHPADKATVDFTVTAPMHFQVVANGLQVEETTLPGNKKITRYSEKIALPTKIMVLGVADFSVQSIGEVGCIPITSWVYAEDREKGQPAYLPASEALEFFIKNVGPYPYRKLANVQSKTIFGGLENANTIFYSENSVTGKNQNETLVVHEVAHQWFGNNVTETDFSHLWLSEGFASYFTHLFIEMKYGADSIAKRMKQDRKEVVDYSKTSKKPVVDPETKEYMELLNANSYQKGSWVLHMLRNKIGDSAFWKGTRNYYNTYAGGNASTEDYRKVMEDASGKSLEKFFNQWLYTGGQPALKIEQQYKDGMFTVTVTQVQPTLFDFPLQFQIDTGNEMSKLIKSIEVSSRQASFRIPLKNKPVSLTVDPNVNLLFELVSNK